MAIGLIETVGLVPAIEACDAAQKTADVVLLGIENARGGGRIVVKLEGNVSAVFAAVEAGVSAAVLIGEVYAHKVIPRPSDELDKYLHPKDRDIPQAEELEEQVSQKEKTEILAEDTKTPSNQVKQNEKTKISNKKEERK